MNQYQYKTSEKKDADVNSLVVFQVDDQRYALPLFNVERVIRMVEITAAAQDEIIGTINIEGIKIPVIDLRRMFGLPLKENYIEDQIIIVSSKRRFAFVIDSAIGVIEADEKDIESADDIFPGLEYLEGIHKQESGMIHVIDPEEIFSDAEIFIENKSGGDV